LRGTPLLCSGTKFRPLKLDPRSTRTKTSRSQSTLPKSRCSDTPNAYHITKLSQWYNVTIENNAIEITSLCLLYSFNALCWSSGEQQFGWHPTRR
jgi:hypothetical protein